MKGTRYFLGKDRYEEPAAGRYEGQGGEKPGQIARALRMTELREVSKEEYDRALRAMRREAG